MKTKKVNWNLKDGLSDEEAIENVMKSWNANRDLGTGMHKCFEEYLNGEPVAQEATPLC